MLVLAGVQTVAWSRQQKGYIQYHPPKGPIPTKPIEDLKKRQSKRERELEMKIQEHTDLLLQLEQELDGAIASGKLTKAELAELQKKHDNLVEEKLRLEEEFSGLQKKRTKLTT